MEEANLNAVEDLDSSSKEHVVVVGGGPVGSLQALLLAKRNFRVDLYERRADIRTPEKADGGRSFNLALSTRGTEALKELGLENAAQKLSWPVHSRMIHSLSGKQSRQYYGKKGQCLYSIKRHDLNKLLLDKVEAHPNINLYFEHQLVRADLNTKELHFSSKQTNSQSSTAEEKQVSCDFIFGCDGAYSTVRRQMMRWGSLNYSQEYIDHGYKELTMPSSAGGQFAMDDKSLHIWPRKEFMMIALPNLDRTFTITLFMPYVIFNSIKTDEDLIAFFRTYFQDSVNLIGEGNLVKEYFANPFRKLLTVKCTPQFMAGSTVILGDAAHAVMPFYGQGVNAGFEDCLIFYEALQRFEDDLEAAASDYYTSHWPDTHAIADFSASNYTEMRSKVLTKTFLLRRYIDNCLHALFPSMYIPFYSMVTFTRIPYSEVEKKHRRQQKWVNRGLIFFAAGTALGLFYLLFWWSGAIVPLRYRILPCVAKCFMRDVIDGGVMN